jgi:hypothetical protein
VQGKSSRKRTGFAAIAARLSLARARVDWNGRSAAPTRRRDRAGAATHSFLLARPILPGHSLLSAPRHRRHHSENYDGEWIARIIQKFGTAPRGSTSRGGQGVAAAGARGESKGVAFTLDGPRGPAEVAQPGAVWLAKATGNPLMPFHSRRRRAGR